MKWNEFYKLPLSIDESGGWVIAQENPMTGYTWAWDWIENDWISEYPVGEYRGAQLADQILRVVNGESDYLPDFKWSVDDKDPVVICMNGVPCMEIRGWGSLTGTGGYHLPAKEAAKIQDDFVKYIVDKLNGN